MKFRVAKDVFDKVNNVCFGVVVAKGINNKQEVSSITKLLDENIQR